MRISLLLPLAALGLAACVNVDRREPPASATVVQPAPSATVVSPQPSPGSTTVVRTP